MNEELQMIAVGGGNGLPLDLTRRQRKRLARFCRGRRFSANLVVDLGNTTDYPVSLVALSGATVGIGNLVDLANADTNCNFWVAAGGMSGIVPIILQTSDGTTSGSFTDPTSGLPTGSFPIGGFIASGGVFWANSGVYASGNQSPAAPINNAPPFASGGIMFASFQRPHRYARLIFSGAAIPQDLVIAGFVSNKRTTGSGGGFTIAPSSGAVSV